MYNAMMNTVVEKLKRQSDDTHQQMHCWNKVNTQGDSQDLLFQEVHS